MYTNPWEAIVSTLPKRHIDIAASTDGLLIEVAYWWSTDGSGTLTMTRSCGYSADTGIWGQ